MKHPLDQWESDAEESQKVFNENSLRQSSLVYQVFCTEAGERLIAEWKEYIIMSPSARTGDDMITIGINEGNKAFMRSIINVMKTHEESQ